MKLENVTLHSPTPTSWDMLALGSVEGKCTFTSKIQQKFNDLTSEQKLYRPAFRKPKPIHCYRNDVVVTGYQARCRCDGETYHTVEKRVARRGTCYVSIVSSFMPDESLSAFTRHSRPKHFDCRITARFPEAQAILEASAAADM